MSGAKGMLHCDVETKQKAVAMFLEGQGSYAAIAKELEIRRPARIRMYRREGEVSFCKPIGRRPKEESKDKELERLRMENALLKKSRPNCGKCSSCSAISGDLPLSEHIPCEKQCAFFGVSRAAYYAGIKRFGQEDRDLERMKLVQEAWARYQPKLLARSTVPS